SFASGLHGPRRPTSSQVGSVSGSGTRTPKDESSWSVGGNPRLIDRDIQKLSSRRRIAIRSIEPTCNGLLWEADRESKRLDSLMHTFTLRVSDAQVQAPRFHINAGVHT